MSGFIDPWRDSLINRSRVRERKQRTWNVCYFFFQYDAWQFSFSGYFLEPRRNENLVHFLCDTNDWHFKKHRGQICDFLYTCCLSHLGHVRTKAFVYLFYHYRMNCQLAMPTTHKRPVWMLRRKYWLPGNRANISQLYIYIYIYIYIWTIIQIFEPSLGIFIQWSLLLTWFNLNTSMDRPTLLHPMCIKCGMKLLFHSLTSTV